MDTSGLINGPCGVSGVDLQGEPQTNNPPANNLYRPKVHVDVLGREFSSCDSAYKFYIDYGGKSGFNVRKHHQTKNKMNWVSRVSYCCSKEGYRQKDKRREVVTYSQSISRVGCRAHMTCLLQKSGKFRIVSFEEGHNHDLIAIPMKHMLKINRSMSEAQRAHANDAEKAGLPIKATVDLLNRWTRAAKARSMKDYHGVGAHDNPKESTGKRYSHLCRNFREIASLVAEHDKLTEYAHHRSIEMLKGLEEIKKSLGEKDCTSGVQNLKGKVDSTGKEHVEIMVEPNNCETIVCGVKRKATVGHPSSRLKDPLEQKKSKSTSKSKKKLLQDDK